MAQSHNSRHNILRPSNRPLHRVPTEALFLGLPVIAALVAAAIYPWAGTAGAGKPSDKEKVTLRVIASAPSISEDIAREAQRRREHVRFALAQLAPHDPRVSDASPAAAASALPVDAAAPNEPKLRETPRIAAAQQLPAAKPARPAGQVSLLPAAPVKDAGIPAREVRLVSVEDSLARSDAAKARPAAVARGAARKQVRKASLPRTGPLPPRRSRHVREKSVLQRLPIISKAARLLPNRKTFRRAGKEIGDAGRNIGKAVEMTTSSIFRLARKAL